MDNAPAAVRQALADLRAGRLIVVTDDHDRENEADLILAAEYATPETLGFMIRHTSGIICVGMAGALVDRLGLEPMVTRNTDPKSTAFTVSVDAAAGVGTGISAGDRAVTIRALVDPASTERSFTKPGHIFPLRARDGGVLVRRGHTEASVDLCRLAGLQPAGVLSEIVDDDGMPIVGEAIERFARNHGLSMVTIDELAGYLDAATHDNVHQLKPQRPAPMPFETRMPTPHGVFDIAVVPDRRTGAEHIVMVLGEVSHQVDVPVRIHSECATGDLFGSLRCDCGEQLQEAMRRIGESGHGVLIYMRGHEGRGIGLPAKLSAYHLQDKGLDTVDANLVLGLPVDDRDYAAAADILSSLEVSSVRLLSNNPAKRDGLIERGVAVSGMEPLCVEVAPEAVAYLRSKRDRLGHQLFGYSGLLDDGARAR
ncbi:3,4-dihydroxy-2-butanone-4-phosphate synthase [Mycobacterium sp. ITM-2016-00317]|uniref:3,4-dihydroxy-2-butanone-4-phosphate synthase n=1 Tax=Mycobacterium sp. ITM-2016-00317 TaxID=2099694 RepID=UPI00287FD906|nr:3,4-dihydroxy-2-butanone-4-phosphate synthase [Mycobacterium sp. ITM-2016-00317]WNG87527.1 3,4-dihydroxy-2-butanone-4-phosphate synthase [Mycobacterium sp. ITM-2016-00317]